MSLFEDDAEKVKRAIQYFNSLDPKIQTDIISDLRPNAPVVQEHIKGIQELLYRIQRDLAKYNDIKIGNKLIELGLDETYARLFTRNIKKFAPTIEYMTKNIDGIKDDHFVSMLPEFMQSLWPTRNASNIATVHNLEPEIANNLIKAIGVIMNKSLKGSKIEDIVNSESINLSSIKKEKLIEQLKNNRQHWFNSLLFRNTQKTYSHSEQILGQNDAILSMLEKILVVLQDIQSKQISGGFRGLNP